MAAMLQSLAVRRPRPRGPERPRSVKVPPLGPLEAMPAPLREQTWAWARHVREVETGRPDSAVDAGEPRPRYDPVSRTRARREKAKAAELTAAELLFRGMGLLTFKIVFYSTTSE